MIPKRSTRTTRTEPRNTETIPARRQQVAPEPAPEQPPAKKVDQRIGVLQRQLAAMAELNLPSDDGSPDRTP